MKKAFKKHLDRRNFIKTTATATAISGLSLIPQACFSNNNTTMLEGINIVGPKEGYSPQIGTLVSMMNWMRMVVLSSVRGISQKDLDYLHDDNANTIGAMLLHLAATEVWYQDNTFQGISNFSTENRKRFGDAMNLGNAGRKSIKGNDLQFYLDTLEEVRNNTLEEFKKRDDNWLMEVDPSFFGGQPTNNYCKWFHVVEHESNHNGQIKFLKSRIS